ncbi:hypothetical protein C2E23DRAFT_473517 [Lenzites betulinus]|nr:hypothetical protein C2E23DRAFT_473517 [Lenzites betulinus]
MSCRCPVSLDISLPLAPQPDAPMAQYNTHHPFQGQNYPTAPPGGGAYAGSGPSHAASEAQLAPSQTAQPRYGMGQTGHVYEATHMQAGRTKVAHPSSDRAVMIRPLEEVTHTGAVYRLPLQAATDPTWMWVVDGSDCKPSGIVDDEYPMDGITIQDILDQVIDGRPGQPKLDLTRSLVRKRFPWAASTPFFSEAFRNEVVFMNAYLPNQYRKLFEVPYRPSEHASTPLTYEDVLVKVLRLQRKWFNAVWALWTDSDEHPSLEGVNNPILQRWMKEPRPEFAGIVSIRRSFPDYLGRVYIFPEIELYEFERK